MEGVLVGGVLRVGNWMSGLHMAEIDRVLAFVFTALVLPRHLDQLVRGHHPVCIH
jgi:hypothetical protein